MKRVFLCIICLSAISGHALFAKAGSSIRKGDLYGSYEDYHDANGNYREFSYEDDDEYSDDYEDDDDEYEDDDDGYYDENQKEHEKKKRVSHVYNATRAGDQQLKITVGASFPTSFGNPLPGSDGKIKLGGYGTFGYHFFLKDWFSVGADIGFGFNPTLADHMFNHVPILATATLQPAIGNFEFPITIGVGTAWETYNNKTYWPGLIFEGDIGIRYKISQSWGAGIEAAYKAMPQFGRSWGTGKETVVGTFLTISACANYYF